MNETDNQNQAIEVKWDAELKQWVPTGCSFHLIEQPSKDKKDRIFQ